LNPIFLQELLGYTASKAGLVMAPRGFGTMFSMIVLGVLARRGTDTRPLVGIGFALVALALWRMAGFNLEVSASRVIWPTILQGVGTGLVFPALSAASLSHIERHKVGYAASLYSMTRNVGAALGTSYLTTLLIHQQQIQQSYLVDHINVFTINQMAGSAPGGVNMDLSYQLATGQKQGLMILYGMVQRQAMMLSFNDIYRMLCLIMLLLVPTFIFLHRDTRNIPSAAH
jgi:DHA2 family multidrug resistance protein